MILYRQELRVQLMSEKLKYCRFLCVVTPEMGEV